MSRSIRFLLSRKKRKRSWRKIKRRRSQKLKKRKRQGKRRRQKANRKILRFTSIWKSKRMLSRRAWAPPTRAKPKEATMIIRSGSLQERMNSKCLKKLQRLEISALGIKEVILKSCFRLSFLSQQIKRRLKKQSEKHL